jgi:hypothetical protein
MEKAREEDKSLLETEHAAAHEPKDTIISSVNEFESFLFLQPKRIIKKLLSEM